MSRTASPSSDYMKLIREFPLRPIRNVREYEEAARIIDRLAIQTEGSLSPGEQDYLDALTLVVEAYDRDHFDMKLRSLTPVDVLKNLMAEHEMKTSDLGRLLGNRALASLILNGKRGLSKTHIRILADHFNVEPGLFLGM